MNDCRYHADHETRIKRNTEDIQSLWHAHDRQDVKIDGMKNWVIAGMAGLLIQLLIYIGSVIMG